MLQINCPWCGMRAESEFTCGGEGGIEAKGGVGSVHGGLRGRADRKGHSSPAPRL